MQSEHRPTESRERSGCPLNRGQVPIFKALARLSTISCTGYMKGNDNTNVPKMLGSRARHKAAFKGDQDTRLLFIIIIIAVGNFDETAFQSGSVISSSAT
ncbi:hypothetical protein O1611_g6285 [Lasiodiplodia mahajangana]|uniref:Uncharacterized protein n=1 Tax=Lasiodiplodia mahajangana TaxID=1108764 RepID=A0ACC2JJ11_9PEZI|nr:hypothetical protein O1611_g6285 [Lasiodiplodia mahajangana]